MCDCTVPPLVRYGLAGVLGGLYGVGVSWVVNCTLVEISVNTFFAVVSLNTNQLFSSNLCIRIFYCYHCFTLIIQYCNFPKLFSSIVSVFLCLLFSKFFEYMLILFVFFIFLRPFFFYIFNIW